MAETKPRAEFLLYDIEDKVTLNAILFMPDQAMRSAVGGLTAGPVAEASGKAIADWVAKNVPAR